MSRSGATLSNTPPASTRRCLLQRELKRQPLISRGRSIDDPFFLARTHAREFTIPRSKSESLFTGSPTASREYPSFLKTPMARPRIRGSAGRSRSQSIVRTMSPASLAYRFAPKAPTMTYRTPALSRFRQALAYGSTGSPGQQAGRRHELFRVPEGLQHPGLVRAIPVAGIQFEATGQLIESILPTGAGVSLH